jgi:hypothetical protein
MNAAVSRLRARIAEYLPYLAWVSFILALTGGVLLPGTGVGEAISDFIKSVTWVFLPPIVFILGVGGATYDILRDAIPDRIAVYTAALAPTFAGAIDGFIAEWVTGFSDWVASWSVDWLEDATGLVEPQHVAIVALVLAFGIARKVMKDKKSTMRGHGGAH